MGVETALSAGRYVAYPEYKDSGVEWLGAIPNDWDCIKLKYVADLCGEKVEAGSAQQYVGMENVESGNGRFLQKGDVKPEGLSTSFDEGNVLFGKLRPYLAKSWLADFSGICSSEFLVLRSNRVNPKFLNYYTLTEEFINQVDSSTYGSKMPRANWDFISLMGTPVPADELSEKIANFLDHETAKIDTLIKEQQSLIQLLQEKRQAVISHAVTKGLNPDAPMKDSGVEWLGEVPEHWDIWKFSHFAPIVTCGIASTPTYVTEEEGMPFLSAQNIRENKLSLHKYNFIPHELHKQLTQYRKPERDDILVTRVGAGIGAACIVDIDMEFSIYVSLTHIRVDPKIANNRFIMYFFGSEYCQYLNHQGTVTGGGVGNLNVQNVLKYLVPLPSTDEQELIVNFIDAESVKFDRIIEEANTAIAFMQERRTALISAAVTGKIDVRDWQAPEQQKAAV